MKWLLKGKPYAAQEEAMRRGSGHNHYGYFLEMGLGKTAVTLNDALDALHHDLVAGIVVVAPNYLKSTWVAEAAHWGLGLPVTVWPQEVPKPGQPFMFVINPEAILHSGGDYLFRLMQRVPCMLAVDESALMKNFNADITKALLNRFRDMAPVRRALSGLPMTNTVMDLWPQLRFCGALNGTNPFAFRNRFAVKGGYMGKKVTGVKNEEELHRIMDACSFRALKRDWIDLPEKIFPQPIEYEMAAEQLAAYRTMMAEFYAMVDGHEVFAEMVLHQMTKLSQISRGFMLDGDVALELVPPDKNPALLAVRSLLEGVRGKTIVFAHHRYSVAALRAALARDGHDFVVLEGGMGEAEMAERKRRFNEDPACRILVGQLSVTNRGHTLLGGEGDDRCSTTVYYENTYSLDIRKQSEDRNHRIGQDRAVVYVDLVGSPMDRKVAKALQRKTDLVEAVLDGVRQKGA